MYRIVGGRRVGSREIFHPSEKDYYDFSGDDLSGYEGSQWNEVNHPFSQIVGNDSTESCASIQG